MQLPGFLFFIAPIEHVDLSVIARSEPGFFLKYHTEISLFIMVSAAVESIYEYAVEKFDLFRSTGKG
jgi:hypothetical protein